MKKEPTGRHSRSLWIVLMGVASVALALLTFLVWQAGHTAVALISLVAILTLLAWRLVQRTQSVVFRHAPIIVGMGVIVIAGSLWQVMQGQGRTRVREILALEANHLAEHLVAFTQTEVMRLVWEAGRPVARMEAPAARRTQWAESFLERHPSYVALTLVDRNCRFLWGTTRPGLSDIVPIKDWLYKFSCPAIQKVARRPRVLVSGPAAGLEPGGFLVTGAQTGDPVPGCWLGAIDLSLLIKAALAGGAQANDLSVTVTAGGRRIYARELEPATSERLRRQWLRATEIHALGRNYRIEVWPNEKWLRKRRTFLPEFILLGGILAAIMLGVTVRLAQMSRRRATEAEQARCEAERQADQRKLAQEKLEESARQLARKNEELALALSSAREAIEMKSRFLAAMSHEVRTPMNGVLGMNELLLCTDLNEEQRQYAAAMKESTEALLRIVNDILDFSKIDAGKLEIESVPFQLRTNLRAVHTLLLPQARAKGLKMAFRVDNAVPDWVRGDPGRLRQVLFNLAGNAIKFTESGQVSLEVTMEEPGEQIDRIRFMVNDTGIGIPADQLEAIFEDFTQVDTSTTRRFGGTGLGLSISKRLVEMMGGRIGCTSEEGRGSTFWFVLPFGKASAADGPCGEAPAAAHSAANPGLPARRVLVIEDNRVNRTVAVRLLAKEGCHVDAVEDGPHGIEAVRQRDYDLVLMDVNMPGMDGFQATAEIRRQEPPGRHIPIVAMTARAMRGDREACLAAGMDDYISKPVSVEDLRRVLDRWAPAQRAAPPQKTV